MPDPALPRRNVLVLHNPRAGRSGRARVDRVVAAMRARGAEVALRSLDGGRDTASMLADAESFDLAVAAGGDGTLRSVLIALGPRPLPVGLVPVGTGNVFAHEVGLPRDPDALADVLLSAPAIPVEAASANGTPFYLMAGVGFDGSVIRRLDATLKSRVGKLAYAAPLIRALAEPPASLEVSVDGRPLEAEWVVATRSRCYGGGFCLARDASLVRPGLVAVVFLPTGMAGRLMRLAALAAGRLHRAGGVLFLPCRTLTVTSGRPAAVEVDGDAFGQTPLTIEAGTATARLVIPESYLRRAADR